MDSSDIQEALLTAVSGELERERGYFLTNAAINRQNAKINREAATFRKRVFRFLGEMPEDWTIMDVIDALEGDREGEVMEDEDD